MHRSKMLLRALCLSLALHGALAAADTLTPTPSGDIKAGLPYLEADAGRRDAYRRELCLLDLHVPNGVTGFATVVWFHGEA